ncbi:MAG TPA: creatininase family protein [Acidobacteriota bacterium]|nr:creatininase family protein [Acidobacteriota bacterium]
MHIFKIVILIVFVVQADQIIRADTGTYLGNLTWPEAKERLKQTPVVIVPFGAGAKEHGPHLPLNADYKVVEYLCKQAAEKSSVIIAPPIQHGWFPAFRQFPGTEIEDANIFEQYVYFVAKSLVNHGAQRILFLNTGISKATGLPISIAAREIRYHMGTPTLVISWDDLENEEYKKLQEQKFGGHADEIETSINLYLQPELVQMKLAVTDYGSQPVKDYPGYQPGLYSTDPDDPNYSKTGITGDPTKATAEKGQMALEILRANLLKAIEGFSKTPLKK